MHLLIVSQYFWPESFRINDLAQEFVKRGHEVTVLTGIPNYPKGKFYSGYNLFSHSEVWQGVNIIRVPIIPRGKANAIRLSLNYLSFMIMGCLLCLLRCPKKFDALFVFQTSPITAGLPAIVLKKIYQVPVYFWVQDLWPETLIALNKVKSKIALGLITKFVKYIYQQCDVILVQSRGFIDSILNHGISRDKIVYLPNWAESLYLKEVESVESPAVHFPEGFNILFAGNLGESQGLETIIEAAELTKDNLQIHWNLLGEGRVKEKLQQQINEKELSQTVHLHAKRPIEEMPAYFKACDTLLVTLQDNFLFRLTIPSKLQCYLASGKPILGALNGESAHILKESGAGLVADAEDPKQLAAAALNMSALSEHKRQEMGELGKVYYQANFSREECLSQLESLLPQTKHSEPCVV
ncbi:Glycosyltransferase involved in cell wall biosynthesis [Planctomycetales bacterium 10988]|nr:Glycosyltransferase involved in cell wall biosynthesis [Planctomycetales bacterium 10988]